VIHLVLHADVKRHSSISTLTGLCWTYTSTRLINGIS